MKRVTAACLLLAIPASSHADGAEPTPTFELRPHSAQPPFNEAMEVELHGMADFWKLAGMEQSLLVGAGGGYQDRALATLDVAFRRKTFHSAWDLLPTTIESGAWLRDGHSALPLAVGWQLLLGLFSAPYVVADGVAAWTPAASRLDAGFDLGLGYEWRLGKSWSVDADIRLVGLWQAAGSRAVMDESPWGVRGLVSMRRFFGE
jgi:hypothetical protein